MCEKKEILKRQKGAGTTALQETGLDRSFLRMS